MDDAPLVYVEWDDHWSMSAGWHTDKAVSKESSEMVIKTIGWLVRETDKHYVVTSHKGKKFQGGPTFILKNTARIWHLDMEE